MLDRLLHPVVMRSSHRFDRMSGEPMSEQNELRYGKILMNNGRAIPALGFGTLISDLGDTQRATRTAVEVGLRQFDCSERYRNEEAVGEALQGVLREGTVRRDDLFVMNMKAKPQLEQSTREEQIRTALNAHWHASAVGDANAEHDIYDDDTICDYPHSGERILGRRTLQALRSHHPGKPSGFEVKRVLGHCQIGGSR